MSCVVTTLKSKKCKITPQRLAIYDILKNRQEHLNTESIYKILTQNYPTIRF